MNIYPAPGGSSRVVVGTEYYQDAIDAVREQDPDPMYARLVREPDNPHDPNAIAVTILDKKVGHISAGMAKEYAPLMDTHLQDRYVAVDLLEFTPGEDGGAEIRMDLAWPRDFIDEWSLNYEPQPTPEDSPATAPAPVRNDERRTGKSEPAASRPKKQHNYTGVAKFYRGCAYVLLALGLLGSALNGSILFLGLAALFWWMQKKMPVAKPKGDTDAA